MKNRIYSLQEAQEIWTKLVEQRSIELKNELKALKNKNSNSKELSYV
jgi:hypothetical protein